MPLNEYGEKLDSNGYAPSILHDKPVCLICGRYGTARHEGVLRECLPGKEQASGPVGDALPVVPSERLDRHPQQP